MAFFSDMKRAIRTTALPCVFIGVAVYFAASAFDGERGTRVAAQRRDVLQTRQTDLTRAEAERDLWDRRVTALRSSRIDRDMLDERARAMLNLVDPDEVIVQYGPKDRLF